MGGGSRPGFTNRPHGGGGSIIRLMEAGDNAVRGTLRIRFARNHTIPSLRVKSVWLSEWWFQSAKQESSSPSSSLGASIAAIFYITFLRQRGREGGGEGRGKDREVLQLVEENFGEVNR